LVGPSPWKPAFLPFVTLRQDSLCRVLVWAYVMQSQLPLPPLSFPLPPSSLTFSKLSALSRLTWPFACSHPVGYHSLLTVPLTCSMSGPSPPSTAFLTPSKMSSSRFVLARSGPKSDEDRTGLPWIVPRFVLSGPPSEENELHNRLPAAPLSSTFFFFFAQSYLTRFLACDREPTFSPNLLGFFAATVLLPSLSRCP